MYVRLALQNAHLMAMRHLLFLLDAHIGVATRSVLLAGHVAPMHGALRALRYVLEEANVDDVLTNGSEGVAVVSRMLIALVMCLAVQRSDHCSTLRADDVMAWRGLLRDVVGRVYVVSGLVAPLTQDPSPEGNLPPDVLDAYQVCHVSQSGLFVVVTQMSC
jgi:hypothetical protein